VVSKKVLIGCSGYYYSHWRNKFYPDSLSSARWLSYYSDIFNSVELNAPFYRLPQVSALKKYVVQTPADFQFAVKVHRQITHVQKLNECDKLIEDFFRRIQEGLGNKLGSILFQLPPSFICNEENFKRIEINIPSDKRVVIEFRNESWWNEKVFELLTSKGISFCNTDYAGLHQTFTQTSENFYARLHGATQLFKSEYSESELEFFARNIPRSNSISVYFNNTYYDAAYKNALTLKNLIELF